MKKFYLFLAFMTLSTFVNAQSISFNKSSFFVGVDVNDVMVDTDDIPVSYYGYGKNAIFSPNIDDSDVNFSLNFGYKYYLPQTKLFFMPRFSYDFGKLKLDGDFSLDSKNASAFPIVVEEEWETSLNLDLKPTYGMDIAFGYQFNKNNEIYLGVGLKNVDYLLSVKNSYTKEEENELTDIDTILVHDVFYSADIADDNKIVYPFSIGYIYNWKDMSFDIGYSYASFDVDDIDIKVSTIKLGAKYMF